MCKLPNKPHGVPLLSIRYSQSATLFVTIRSPPTGKLLTEYSGCEPRQLHHRHRARGHGRQGYGVVAAVASVLQFWHCLTLIFTAHSSTFPLLKATTCTFTPKNLWRHYTKQSFRHSYIFIDGHFSGSLYWHRWRFCSQASKIIQVERRERPCLYALTS